MDGLVLDTEPTYFKAWQSAALRQGQEFSEQFCRSLSGLPFQTVEQKILEICTPEFELQQFRRDSGTYWRQYVKQYGINIKKGFFALLEVLNQQTMPYCLATNSLHDNAIECLVLAGIRDKFKLIISRDQVKQGKPAPDIFLEAAEQLGVGIKQCLIVEDSVCGLAAAKSAGACCILVPSVQPVPPETAAIANLILKDLSQLADLIKFKH